MTASEVSCFFVLGRDRVLAVRTLMAFYPRGHPTRAPRTFDGGLLIDYRSLLTGTCNVSSDEIVLLHRLTSLRIV